ncbi:MAG: hypothetical protein RR335_09425 [Eubacterium sp.]
MWDLSFVADIVFFIILLISSIYGIIKFFKKKAVLFMQIIVCAIICMALGQLFNIVYHLTAPETSNAFHVGILGMMGCYFFLFSASFGQIDGLGDSKDKSLRAYRIIPIVMPICFIACYGIIFMSDLSLTIKVIDGIIILVIALTSYFNLKHLILPDVACGILESIRKYNALIITITIVTMIKLLLPACGYGNFTYISTFILAVLYIFVIPTASKGVKKWFQ